MRKKIHITAATSVNTGIISQTNDFGHSGLSWRNHVGSHYVVPKIKTLFE